MSPISPCKPTVEELALDYIVAKMSTEEMGVKYDVTRQTIVRWLAENDIPIRGRGRSKGDYLWDDDERVNYMQDLDEGLSLRELSEKHDVKYHTLRARLIKYDLWKATKYERR